MSSAFDDIGRQPRKPLARPARVMTYELTNHAKPNIEDGQYVAAFDWLESNLTANASVSKPAIQRAAWVPPANILALASTLIAYPHITTKAKSPEQTKGADAAFFYLKNVAYHVDSLHDGFRQAFAFPEEISRRHRGLSGSPELDFDWIRGHAANANAIWNRATDFWHIVGWAFNCSVRHKKRWERWEMWLKVMLVFVERDWEARHLQAQEVEREGGDAKEIYKKSLLWHYIRSKDATIRTKRLRMVRAICARGLPDDLTGYKEVWPKETAGPKIEEPEKKSVVKIDIENDIYGDFNLDDEDELMGDTPLTTSKLRRRAVRSAKLQPEPDSSHDNDSLAVPITTEDAIALLGGIEAVTYRARLIALLAKATQALPEDFTHTDELFELFTIEITSLPVMIFDVLLSYSHLDGRMQTALNANLLLPMMKGIKHSDWTRAEPTQLDLEDYLPKRGDTKSYAQNAKVSLILEKLFLYLINKDALVVTPALRTAVEKGISERQSVWGTANRTKGNDQEEEMGKRMLEASSKRMIALLTLLEQMRGAEDGEDASSVLSDVPTSDSGSGDEE